VKAINVRQPWASLLRDGIKTIELRSWNTHYRGAVVVCASGSKPTGEYASVARERGLVEAPRGVVMCLVDIVDSVPAVASDEARACFRVPHGHFAWRVRLVTRLDPVPVRGRLNFWDIDDRLLTVRGKSLDVSRFAMPRSRWTRFTWPRR